MSENWIEREILSILTTFTSEPIKRIALEKELRKFASECRRIGIDVEDAREIRFPVSLRDWFAGQTLRKFGLEAGELFKLTAYDVDKAFEMMAKICYLSADAMIAEKRRIENGEKS